MEARVGTRGRITIPSSVRRAMGMKGRTRIVIEVDEANKRIILTPITREYIRSRRGSLKGIGAMKSLMEEKMRERNL